jgi:hypothetical protein
MTRDPEPAGAPEGGPADGRFPASDASFEQSAERFATFADRLSADRPDGDPVSGAPAPAGPAAEPAAAPRTAAPRTTGFRAWRGRRPFLGGLLLTLGGVEILVCERASLGVVIHIGMEGLSGYLIPAMMVVCGLLAIFNPAQRLFYAVLGVLLTLGSWVTSDLGGFFAGLVLGVVGSCLTFGWLPDQEPRRPVFGRSRRRAPGGNAARS